MAAIKTNLAISATASASASPSKFAIPHSALRNVAHGINEGRAGLQVFNLEFFPLIKDALNRAGTASMQTYILKLDSASNFALLAYSQIQKARGESSNILGVYNAGLKFYLQATNEFSDLAALVNGLNMSPQARGEDLPIYLSQAERMKEHLILIIESKKPLATCAIEQ